MITRIVAKLSSNKTTSIYQDSTFQMVLQLLVDGKYTKVNKYVQTCHADALRSIPLLSALVLLQGCALYAMGNYRNAVAELRKAVQLNPTLTELHEVILGIQRYFYDPSQMVDTIQIALAQDPDHATTWHRHRATICFEVGDIGEAMKSAKTAIASDPNNSSSIYVLVKCYLELNRYDAAESVLTEYFRNENNGDNAIRVLAAQLKFKRKLLDEAIDEANAISKDESSIVCRFFRDKIKPLEQEGKQPELFESLVILTYCYIILFSARLLKLEALYQLGQFQQATLIEPTFRKLITAYEECTKRLLKLKFKMGNYDDEGYKFNMEVNGRRFAARGFAFLGECFYRIGDISQAKICLRDGLSAGGAHYPTYEMILGTQAAIHLIEHNLADAEKAKKELFELNRNSAVLQRLSSAIGLYRRRNPETTERETRKRPREIESIPTERRVRAKTR